MPKINLLAAVINSAMPTGYRRAGHAFEKGENQLEIDEAQLAKIKQDHNLLVQSAEPLEPVKDHTTQGSMDNDRVGKSVDVGGLDAVALDLSAAPEELATFIACIHDLAKESPLSKKPNCDQIAFTYVSDKDDAGIEQQRTPSGAERDAAWDWYQDNVVNSVNSTTNPVTE